MRRSLSRPRVGHWYLSVVIGLLAFIVPFLWFRQALTPIDPKTTTPQVFVIPKGQSIDKIGKRLHEAKLIRSAAVFKIYVTGKGLATKIQAGDFRLNPSMNLAQIAENLTTGTLDIWVTLLEGWRREEMAAKLVEEFAAKDATFDTAGFLQASDGLEGYLFPDTYLIPPTASGSAVASQLKNTFAKKVSLTNNQSGLSTEQAIILASILEREVATKKDRPIIAGILTKRWQNKWPLQADATIQYLLGTRTCHNQLSQCNWWPQNITKQDLQINSPYNTYTQPGLPPTPISNPGLASIEAALQPQESEYWFYISDLQGNIHYAKTIEEHNQNIAKYLNK